LYPDRGTVKRVESQPVGNIGTRRENDPGGLDTARALEREKVAVP